MGCSSVLRFVQSQCLQVLDNLHSFIFGQLATDYAVALWAIVEFVPRIRIAGQIGTELSGAFEGLSVQPELDCLLPR